MLHKPPAQPYKYRDGPPEPQQLLLWPRAAAAATTEQKKARKPQAEERTLKEATGWEKSV